MHASFNGLSGEWIDLSHLLSPEMPTWEGSCGFCVESLLERSPSGALGFQIERLQLLGGAGTHMDAPWHLCESGKRIDAIEPDQLMAPCQVIQVPFSFHSVLRVDDLIGFEKRWGLLQRGSWLLVSSGWDQYWSDSEKYRGLNKDSGRNLSQRLFPSIDPPVASFLLDRGIVGLGVDTLSPDLPDSSFEVHQILLSAGCLIVENLRQLAKLPPVGAFVSIHPLKAPLAEAPVRAWAFVNAQS